MATVEIGLLGRFSVSVDGLPISGDAWRSRRAADVVKLLALAPGHRMPRTQLMEALWPESDPQASGTNLRKALYFARIATGVEDVVANEHGSLVLWPGAEIETDVERFEAAARRAIDSCDPAMCRAAADQYASELLPDDRYELWTIEPRANLQRRFLEVLRAGQLWDRLFDADPTDEQAARSLMRNHLDAGERRLAIGRFERLREALRDQLGVGPDPSTVALYEQVLAAEGAPQPSEEDRAHALLAWGLMHVNRGDLLEAERAAEEARSIALDAGLGRELGESAVILAKVAMAQGRWRERFAEDLVESMRMSAQLTPIVYDAHLCLAEYFLAAPEGHNTAALFARRMMEVADEAGSKTGAALAMLMLGEALLIGGDLVEAETHLHEAAEANERLGCLSGAALAKQRLAEAAVARGRRFDAQRLLTRARALAGRSDIVTHLLVRIYGTMIQAAADPRRAMSVLRVAESELAQLHSCEPCSMGYLTAAVAASAQAGQLDRARGFLTEAERIAGMWQGGLWSGAVWEARGHLRRAEGDEEQAKAMFKEAAEVFAQAGDERAADRTQAVAASLGRD